MTLLERAPAQLPPDDSCKTTVSFQSPRDGSGQRVDVYSPSRRTDGPLPLVLAPHPITWTAEQDYHGGLEGLKITYADRLARVPTFLYWTAHDLVVPHQVERHSYRLYHAIKDHSITAPAAEYEHTTSHGLSTFDKDTCWQLHEWCDYELALRWLLTHVNFRSLVDT